jgi:hypothetical protein
MKEPRNGIIRGDFPSSFLYYMYRSKIFINRPVRCMTGKFVIDR